MLHNRPEKLANHGSQRLWPIALPVGRQHPSPVHRPHPHIIGNMNCAWFGRPTHWGWVIWYNRHIVKVLHISSAKIYTAPLSIVPPVVSFPVPDALIMSSMSSSMVTWFLSTPSASLSLFKASHSSSVKSRTAATTVLFWTEDRHHCQISCHPSLNFCQICCHPNLSRCWIWLVVIGVRGSYAFLIAE